MSEPIDTDSEGNPLTLIDIISTDDTIAEDLDRRIKTEKLLRFVDEIANQREKATIVMRYGLDGKEPMTQREVAKLMNISRSYVSRIEKRAIENLRRKFT